MAALLVDVSFFGGCRYRQFNRANWQELAELLSSIHLSGFFHLIIKTWMCSADKHGWSKTFNFVFIFYFNISAMRTVELLTFHSWFHSRVMSWTFICFFFAKIAQFIVRTRLGEAVVKGRLQTNQPVSHTVVLVCRQFCNSCLFKVWNSGFPVTLKLFYSFFLCVLM